MILRWDSPRLKHCSSHAHCKLSRGKICVPNFIPPANGASLGSYFVLQISQCLKNPFHQLFYSNILWQTDTVFDTIYRVWRFYISFKFATSLLALLAEEGKNMLEEKILIVELGKSHLRVLCFNYSTTQVCLYYVFSLICLSSLSSC